MSANASEAPSITIERDGHVLLIGINRPHKRNAFTVDAYERLGLAYGELDRDPNLFCGVLHAHGDHFTGGLDLVDWSSVITGGALPVREGGLDPVGVFTPRVRKPVVCAVQGICYTIGFELLLSSDVRIAAPSLSMAQLEVKRGIYPFGGATLRMHREIGWSNAMRWMLTGDAMTADEALRLGLVSEIVPQASLLDRAKELAHSIAKQAPLAVQAVMASSQIVEREGQAAATARLFPDLQKLLASDDAREGVASFIERREARFTGK
ncbi:crotonase/enoyl-CoA hydratase family protein [soil metagenome]